jgi:hypothetical protein
MFTVVVGLEASGANNTRKPLLSRYSVIPSTCATAFKADAALCDHVAKGTKQLAERIEIWIQREMGFERMSGHISAITKKKLYTPALEYSLNTCAPAGIYFCSTGAM